jgi:hypothetical protein
MYPNQMYDGDDTAPPEEVKVAVDAVLSIKYNNSK